MQSLGAWTLAVISRVCMVCELLANYHLTPRRSQHQNPASPKKRWVDPAVVLTRLDSGDCIHLLLSFHLITLVTDSGR